MAGAEITQARIHTGSLKRHFQITAEMSASGSKQAFDALWFNDWSADEEGIRCDCAKGRYRK